jgi:hypothetical protein
LAVVVSDGLVVSAETILRPLQAVLEEAIAINGFVDLQNHLPIDILEQEEDTRIILEKHVLPDMLKQDESKPNAVSTRSESAGVLVLSSNGVLFVSSGMIQDIQQKSMPDLIARHAKGRAEYIDTTAGENRNSQSKSSADLLKKKGGRKGKKGAKAHQEENDTAEDSKDLVPLISVVERLGVDYPELLEVDSQMKEALAQRSNPNTTTPFLSWETPQNTDGNQERDANSSLNQSVLCELCRSCLYTDAFTTSCKKALQVELKRIESARMSKASVSRKDAAAKVRNVEGAFEEAFVNMCYLLQAHVKFLKYVESSECPGDGGVDSKADLIENLTSHLLRGCCADFTSRLTQYCLFKNEVDPGIFQFLRNPSHSDTTAALADTIDSPQNIEGLLSYCAPVDLAARQYPSVFLHVVASADPTADVSGKVNEPLPLLREVLPGSIGVSLARQWIACGGSCYQGGSKIDDDGGTHFTRPGDIDKFMELVEENCLYVERHGLQPF